MSAATEPTVNVATASAASAPVNVADYVAATLARAGVSTVFGYPGDPIIEFMERCRQRGVDVTLARREGSAGFMAEGWAMATGRPGACLSTLGPGSTALTNPVAAATLDRVPMLAFSGQIETARQATFTHQVIDHEQLFRPITKWAGRIEANAAAITMRKALRTAMAERPGCVHLTVAADTYAAPLPAGTVPEVPPMRPAAVATRVFVADGGPDPVQRLAQARRPVLLVGIAALRCAAGAATLRFARAVGCPVVVAPMAKGVVAEDDEWFAGVLDMACNETVWELLRDSDLIVAAGFDAVELIKPWSVKTPVMHIDTLPNTDQVYPSEVEVVGDVSLILDWLAEEWSGEPRWTVEEVHAFRRRLRDAYYSGRVTGRLNPTDVVDIARAAASHDTIATCDVGSHKLLVGQGWTTYEPRGTLMTNGLSAMGFGIPAAIGAKLARPERPVMSLVGDGGFAMAATEMRLAASLGLGIVVVVLIDESLNRIELKQAALSYPSTATRIETMDIVKMAEAMDCDGARATTEAELQAALADVAGRTRPLIVETHIDPSQYHSQF